MTLTGIGYSAINTSEHEHLSCSNGDCGLLSVKCHLHNNLKKLKKHTHHCFVTQTSGTPPTNFSQLFSSFKDKTVYRLK